MTGEFQSSVGPVTWETDSKGLRLRIKGRARNFLWNEITRAGLVRLSNPSLATNFPYAIPGVGSLFALNQGLSAEYGQLVLARGSSNFRAFRLPVPSEDPGGQAFVDAVTQGVGERWIGVVPMEHHMKAFGLRLPAWAALLYLIGFLAVLASVLLGVGAFGALLSGHFDQVPMWARLVLLAWVLLIAGVFLKLRIRR